MRYKGERFRIWAMSDDAFAKIERLILRSVLLIVLVIECAAFIYRILRNWPQ